MASLSIFQQKTDDEKLQSSDPYVQLFRSCIETAKQNGASDIHFEPKEDGAVVRLRLNGNLKPFKTIPLKHRDPFLFKVKSMVNLELASLGKPDDARASFPTYQIDVRANSTPLVYGEKVVLRLLEQSRNFDLDYSGIEEDSLEALKKALRKKEGLILISGPTGSGKTTTLYSLLSHLDSEQLNISTIENPVEYRLPGINQIDISSKGRLTFSDSLRALMRQDPDVLLVGEVRDAETAELCFKAAATGHLVLSTLHANGAVEVIDRLLNLGIDRFTLENNLKLSAAQRLLRKLCPHCSKSASNAEDHRQTSRNLRIRNPKGCHHCVEGIAGRIPILEVLKEKQIRRLIRNSEDPETLEFKRLSQITQDYANRGEIDARELNL